MSIALFKVFVHMTVLITVFARMALVFVQMDSMVLIAPLLFDQTLLLAMTVSMNVLVVESAETANVFVHLAMMMQTARNPVSALTVVLVMEFVSTVSVNVQLDMKAMIARKRSRLQMLPSAH